MTNPTSNFNWQMPTASDLVTDLPADFETFGQAVDTSLADLKGGTTGQILSKASGTDMDFTWVTNDVGDITAVTAGTGISGGGTTGAVTITNSMATAIDAKGDLIAGTGADAFSRLAAGANDTVLTADSSTATGLKWAAASTGGMTLLSTTTLSGSTTTVSGISGSYNHLYIFIQNPLSSVADQWDFRLNGTASDYNYVRIANQTTTITSVGSGGSIVGPYVNTVSTGIGVHFYIPMYSNTNVRKYFEYHTTSDAGDNTNLNGWGTFRLNNNAITSFSFLNLNSRTSTGGTMYVYGVK